MILIMMRSRDNERRKSVGGGAEEVGVVEG